MSAEALDIRSIPSTGQVASLHVVEEPLRYLFIQTEPEASIASMRTITGEPIGTYPSWVTEMMGGVPPRRTINAADNPHSLPESLSEYDLIMGGGSSFMPEDTHPVVGATEYLLQLAELEEKEQALFCFSHQVGLRAYGAEIAAHDIEFAVKDVTLTDEGINDPLFAGFPRTFPAFKSHRRRVSSLPKIEEREVVALAESVYPFEVVRTGRHRRSMQYHPELNATVMDGLTVAKHNSGTLVLPSQDAFGAVVRDFYTLGPEAQDYGQKLGENIKRHVARQRSVVNSR